MGTCNCKGNYDKLNNEIEFYKMKDLSKIFLKNFY